MRLLPPLGLLLLLVAAVTPWWSIAYAQDGDVYERVHVHLFREADSDLGGVNDAYSRQGMTVLTGVLVLAAGLLVLFRVLGASWRYEPRRLRRDLRVATLLLALAIASVFLWPQDMPHFWGRRPYPGGAENAAPGVGWWLAAVAAACFGWAGWRAGPEATPSAK